MMQESAAFTELAQLYREVPDESRRRLWQDALQRAVPALFDVREQVACRPVSHQAGRRAQGGIDVGHRRKELLASGSQAVEELLDVGGDRIGHGRILVARTAPRSAPARRTRQSAP